MQYRVKCTDEDWKHEGGILLWKMVDGKNALPDGDPLHVKQYLRKDLDEILGGLCGFIRFWDEMGFVDTDDQVAPGNSDWSLQ